MLIAIPLIYRFLAFVAIVFATFFTGVVNGRKQVQEKWDLANSKQVVQVAAVKERQAEVSAKVVTEYVDRIKIVRQAGETITKEVPVYVTKEADDHCVITTGFVRLHNDAAAGSSVADTPGNPDAATAGIDLSTVAETVAENYKRCHENASELEALQAWAKGTTDKSE